MYLGNFVSSQTTRRQLVLFITCGLVSRIYRTCVPSASVSRAAQSSVSHRRCFRCASPGCSIWINRLPWETAYLVDSSVLALIHYVVDQGFSPPYSLISTSSERILHNSAESSIFRREQAHAQKTRLQNLSESSNNSYLCMQEIHGNVQDSKVIVKDSPIPNSRHRLMLLSPLNGHVHPRRWYTYTQEDADFNTVQTGD